MKQKFEVTNPSGVVCSSYPRERVAKVVYTKEHIGFSERAAGNKQMNQASNKVYTKR